MADYAIFFQLQYVLQDAAFEGMMQIGFFINAMEKSEVNVIGFQGIKLPINRTLDGIQICCPTIFTALIIGTEVDLKLCFFPPAC